MTLERQNNRLHLTQPQTAETVQPYTTLVITQNHDDLVLIKSLLEHEKRCKVYEAGNLKAAFKIASHLEIDLIIVDEKLPSAEGFGIIDKLNKSERMREIPKILLINSHFKKERYDSYRDVNLDFMRKPIDTMMLRARVNTLFKNMHKRPKESIFSQMMVEKMEEAKAFLGIYQSFLEVDENILFIYDKSRNQVIEYNRVFERFFEDVGRVNRVLGSRHLFRKFVPAMEDANYLNHYDLQEWNEIAGMTQDFHFGLKILKDETAYSFTVLLKKTAIQGMEIYVVKLLNNHLYLPEAKEEAASFENCRQDANEALVTLKEEFDLPDKERSYQKIYRQMQKISELVNATHKEDILDIDLAQEREINAYFVISSLLKRYASYKTLYLNGVKVDKGLEENSEEIYVPVNPNALQDAVKGVIDSYFTAPVQYDQRRIRLDLYRSQNELKIEIRASERKEPLQRKERTVLGKFLKKEALQFNSGHKNDILPKNVQHAIGKLDASVEHFSANGETIFLITIPFLEKVK